MRDIHASWCKSVQRDQPTAECNCARTATTDPTPPAQSMPAEAVRVTELLRMPWLGDSPDIRKRAADLLKTQSLALAQQKTERAVLQQQVREFACEEHDVTLGVGRGDGQLFVHGNHESIQAVRAIIAERAALLRRIARTQRFLEDGAPAMALDALTGGDDNDV